MRTIAHQVLAVKVEYRKFLKQGLKYKPGSTTIVNTIGCARPSLLSEIYRHDTWVTRHVLAIPGCNYGCTNRSQALNTSRASNTSRGSDVIVLIEAGGFYSRIYGIKAYGIHICKKNLRSDSIVKVVGYVFISIRLWVCGYVYVNTITVEPFEIILKFYGSNIMVHTRDEFENGCIPMHSGARMI